MTDQTDASQNDTDAQDNDQDNDSSDNNDNTILTGDQTDNSNSDSQTDDDNSSDNDDAADDDNDSDGAPETYEDFKMPEGMEVDQSMVDKFSPVAKELDLSQDKAQKLVDLYAAQKIEDAKADQEAWDKTVDDWTEKSKADSEFGGQNFQANTALANKALSTFGNDGLVDALAASGLSQHPEVIRFMYRIGKELEEGSFIPSHQQGGGGDQSPASKLYPDQGKS